MTTFTDGAPPSVTPEPDDGSVPHRAEAPDADPDTGSAWLHDEIQRRIAEKAAAGGGGRHARRGEPTPSSSAEYIARHSVATPGPGAPRPGPVGGQMSQASELLRRERTEGTTAQPVWSGPPTRPGPVQPAPGASDEEAPAGPVRPGIAAAAAMRGAARGRAYKAAAAAAPPVAPSPPVDATPPAPPRPAPTAPVDPPQPDPAATTPVEATPASPKPTPSSAAPTGPLPAPSPPAAASPSAPTGPVPAVAPRPAAVVPEPVAAEHTAPVPPVPVDDEPSSDPEQPGPPASGISVPEQRGAGQRGSPPPYPDSSIDQAGKRVRVVLAERKSVARPVRNVIAIQEPSGVGELLRSNLIGSQLAIALRFAIGAGLTLGLLPLLFAMVPEIGRVEVLGIRLPWLLLGVLVYPFLFGLGWWHTRTAEHLEQNFAETVQD